MRYCGLFVLVLKSIRENTPFRRVGLFSSTNNPIHPVVSIHEASGNSYHS